MEFQIAEVGSGPDSLLLEASFPGAAPLLLFRGFTEAALLAKWWPPHAEIEPRRGGSFHLAWPDMGWRLRGTHTTFMPGEDLAFTWRWDHEPERPTRNVHIRFEPVDGGTRIWLTHGEYTPSPEDQKERRDHLDGLDALPAPALSMRG